MSDACRLETGSLETLCAHAGRAADRLERGAVTAPLHLSTTFERASDGSYPEGYSYIREANPARRQLEQLLAQLEGGGAGLAFASGTAAIATLFQALSPGDHVLAPREAYYGTPKLLRDHFVPWGLHVDWVDMTDLDAVRAALRPETRLVFVETPSNPLLSVTDLRAVAELAHTVGARVACDNTCATPALQRPLALGCDVVVHSTTKFLGGHSDAMGGALVVRDNDAFAERLRALQKMVGAVPAPFDCWLILRGIRTLPWRLRGHCRNAGAVATFLAGHPGVERVHYPGLADDRGHAVAARQMADFGGLLSFVVPDGRERAFAVASRLTLIQRATSLGGTESLIEHRASVEGEHSVAPEGLLRLSVGLEGLDDLRADLDQALRA
jgi:cystathionine gamma-synthase